MSFAEQLAARAKETTQSSSLGRPNAVPGSSPPRPPGRIRPADGGGGTLQSSVAPSLASPGSSSSLFAEQLKRRAGNNDGAAAPAPATQDAPQSTPVDGALHGQPFSAPSSATISTKSSPGSQNAARGKKGRIRPVDGMDKVQPVLVPTIPRTPGSDDEEDEYSSVGFSLMDASTVSSVGETSVGEGRGHKPSPAKKKPKRRIRPVDSPPGVQRKETTRITDDISPITKDDAFPDESPNDVAREIQSTSVESIDSELQLQLQRRRLQERGKRSLKDETLTQSPSAREPAKTADGNADLGIPTAETDVNDNSAVFGAWAQIESLQRRVHEAEAQARRESQRAESASTELRLAREASISSVQEHSASTVQAVGAAVPQDDAAALWRKRALEAEERLAATAQAQPHTATVSAASRFEESDIIKLKNAEIDVLRSQIHRLERRMQEECDRNEDLLRSSSYHHHPDGTPLVIASEWTSTGSRTSGAEGELRQLREEIQLLQYRLQTGQATGSTAGESTLSSLDGNEDQCGEEEREDFVDGNELHGSSSFWGLCCVRRSRRGYGRV
ncbi:hypothetical protein ACHAXT_010581 [Thalassiosira profunda]